MVQPSNQPNKDRQHTIDGMQLATSILSTCLKMQRQLKAYYSSVEYQAESSMFDTMIHSFKSFEGAFQESVEEMKVKIELWEEVHNESKS